MERDLKDFYRLAFILMMARLVACTSCQGDSHRAQIGCTQCAVQSVKRFHGTDDEFVLLYERSLEDVSNLLNQEIQALP